MSILKEKKLTLVEDRDCNIPSMEEVATVAKKLGWETNILKRIPLEDISNGDLDKHFSGYVMWRGIGGHNIHEIERIMAFLNATNRVTVNTHAVGGIACTSNKFFQHGLFMLDKRLQKCTLPMYWANDKAYVERLIKQKKLEYPFCLKPLHGTRGEGIILIRDAKDLDKIKSWTALGTEPYVDSKFSWRVFVLGGKVCAVMRKTADGAKEDDFKKKCSGVGHFNEDDPAVAEELGDLAVRAAKVSGLEYTGVDFIRADEGRFYILETNFAAGWRNGVEKSTGVSIPAKIVEYFEAQYRKKNG